MAWPPLIHNNQKFELIAINKFIYTTDFKTNLRQCHLMDFQWNFKEMVALNVYDQSDQNEPLFKMKKIYF
jgi:hypothetical protein